MKLLSLKAQIRDVQVDVEGNMHLVLHIRNRDALTLNVKALKQFKGSTVTLTVSL